YFNHVTVLSEYPSSKRLFPHQVRSHFEILEHEVKEDKKKTLTKRPIDDHWAIIVNRDVLVIVEDVWSLTKRQEDAKQEQ
ncbi:hypothetical protein BgiMline_017823, partial [Biomphalaria glabrata]